MIGQASPLPEGLADEVTVYIGLGSNLDEPIDQVRRALGELGQLPESRLLARSSLYRSRPMGPMGQPDYVNAVAALATTLAPLDLLDELQGIEVRHGRVRAGERWGPRSLDLDLLLYGDQVIDNDRLTVPHYGLRQRAFVLQPLREIAPDVRLPGGESLETLAAACPGDGLERLATG